MVFLYQSFSILATWRCVDFDSQRILGMDVRISLSWQVWKTPVLYCSSSPDVGLIFKKKSSWRGKEFQEKAVSIRRKLLPHFPSVQQFPLLVTTFSQSVILPKKHYHTLHGFLYRVHLYCYLSYQSHKHESIFYCKTLVLFKSFKIPPLFFINKLFLIPTPIFILLTTN